MAPAPPTRARVDPASGGLAGPVPAWSGAASPDRRNRAPDHRARPPPRRWLPASAYCPSLRSCSALAPRRPEEELLPIPARPARLAPPRGPAPPYHRPQGSATARHPPVAFLVIGRSGRRVSASPAQLVPEPAAAVQLAVCASALHRTCPSTPSNRPQLPPCSPAKRLVEHEAMVRVTIPTAPDGADVHRSWRRVLTGLDKRPGSRR